MNVRVEPALPWHARTIVRLMDPGDIAKLEAITREPAIHALLAGLTRSAYTFCGLDSDEPLCIGGVIPISAIGDEGLVWMVAQPALNRHKKCFLRESRRILAEMQSRFPVLRNLEPNSRDFRWLRWLGFKLGEEIKMNDLVLVPIERRA